MILLKVAVIRFAVVTCVGREPVDSHVPCGLRERRHQVANVRLRALIGQVAEDKMIRAIDKYAEFRKSRIGRVL